MHNVLRESPLLIWTLQALSCTALHIGPFLHAQCFEIAATANLNTADLQSAPSCVQPSSSWVIWACTPVFEPCFCGIVGPSFCTLRPHVLCQLGPGVQCMSCQAATVSSLPLHVGNSSQEDPACWWISQTVAKHGDEKESGSSSDLKVRSVKLSLFILNICAVWILFCVTERDLHERGNRLTGHWLHVCTSKLIPCRPAP